MGKNVLTNTRGGSAQWWCFIVLLGLVVASSLGYIPFFVRTWLDAVGALILPCLAGGVFFILLLKHPKVAPLAVDARGLRPWVARTIGLLLTIPFVAVTVFGAVSADDAAVMAIPGAIFALIFGFLLVRTWSGTHRISPALFGVPEAPPLPPGEREDLDSDDA